MTRAGARLIVEGVRKAFGPTVALDGASLRVEAGEVHALLGENGAGKSTLMKILAGALAPGAGSLLLDVEPFAPAGPAQARAAGVVIVYQEPQLCPDLTVLENIMLGRELSRRLLLDRRAMRAVVAEALSFATVEQRLPLDTPVRELGPAERQLVAIARALAKTRADHDGCRVLILDEPTASLAQQDVERLFSAVRRLRDQGIAVVYISHFLEEVMRVADRYTVLRDGRTVASGRVADTTPAELVVHMVGREVSELYPRSPRTPGDVLLMVDALAGARLPVRASFDLHAGEILGIAGLVGAGRTELLRALFGLDRVRSGAVRLGALHGPASPARWLAHGLGMVSEDRKGEGLAAPMSLADNLTLSKLAGLGPLGLILPRRQRNAAEVWIERLGIRCRDPEQPVAELSGGNQQKVALARLLYHGVDVLLLDEPTLGIDVGSRAEIYRLVDELAVQGKAVLMVSSYLPELLGVCDRIAVMRRGRLGEAHPVAELDARGLLAEAAGA